MQEKVIEEIRQGTSLKKNKKAIKRNYSLKAGCCQMNFSDSEIVASYLV